MTQAKRKVDDIQEEAGDHAFQYLTFSLAGEEYGVDILGVQEVKVWTKVTVLPNTPVYVKGVLNLRGTVVPIIDLRLCFNMEQVEYDATTVIVVLKLYIEGKERTIGLVVDAVSDVLDINSDQVRTTDEFDMTSQTNSITGVATLENKMVILLDAAKLLSAGELAELSKDTAAVKAEASVTETEE
ncbi:MAG: chemotaxis protein CheW [Gammaproteobacteria bacterium]|nr:MAG: chemotaxis protein CheW [Gammaproteobacteria bacterium]